MKMKLLTILLAMNLIMISFVVFQSLKISEGYPITVKYTYPAVEAAEKKEHPPETEAEEIPPEVPQEPATTNSTISVVFPLELNQATAEQLLLIPKIGKITSQRIVQYRDYLGQYTNLEQLMEIKGIGKETYAEISRYLYLEGDAWNIETDQEQQ